MHNMSRKRKVSLRERASEMNKLKVEKRLRSGEVSCEEVRAGTSEEMSEDTREGTSAVDTVPFEYLPAPLKENSSDEEANEGEDYEGSIAEDEIHATFEDWVSDMKRTDKQKLTMIVYDNYI